MKAILVVDMPKIDENTKNGCRNCRYARKRMTLSEDYLCSITEQSAYVYDMNCPLKPMPQRKYEGNRWTEYYDVAGDYLKAQGYNKCIDEILGEEKE